MTLRASKGSALEASQPNRGISIAPCAIGGHADRYSLSALPAMLRRAVADPLFALLDEALPNPLETVSPA
jgi:hypothetical protein